MTFDPMVGASHSLHVRTRMSRIGHDLHFNKLTGRPSEIVQLDLQIAKSLYSGLATSVGEKSMPAPTVAFVPCSMRIKEPVSRLVA